MPKLASYSVNDAFNKKLLDMLPAGSAIKERKQIHVTGESLLSTVSANAPGLVYPRTALGTLKSHNVTTTQIEHLNLVTNKHHNATVIDSLSQLILLDSEQATDIKSVLLADANGTFPLDPRYMLLSNPSTVEIMNNADLAREALQAWQTTKTFAQSDPNGLMLNKIAAIKQAGDFLFQNLIVWLYHGETNVSQKFIRNEIRSTARLKTHYKELAGNIPTTASMKQKSVITETRGEYASTKIILTSQSKEFQIKIGKSSAGRPNGIDQIWVERCMLSGNVKRYILVEAKGSINAHQNYALYGEQMSPRWVFHVLLEMASKNAAYVDVNHGSNTAVKILEALITRHSIPVSGVIVKSLFGQAQMGNVLDMQSTYEYIFADQYEQLNTPQHNPIPVMQNANLF